MQGPNEDSAGLDADEDGCIDSFSGLIDEAADLLIAYADNLVTQLLSELAPGESC